MRAPRTRFAASFVAIVASCGSPQREPQQQWRLTSDGSGGCFASPVVCDRCNPPAPIAMACPAGAATDGSARIVSYDAKTCELGGKPIDCPTYASAPPPPPPVSIDAAPARITRTWSLSKDPHGACSYFEDPCSKLARAPGEPIPPCNPPPSKPIACPPYVDATMGAQVVQHDDGTCAVASTGAHVDCLP